MITSFMLVVWKETFLFDISTALSLQHLDSLFGWYAKCTKTGSRCYCCCFLFFILKWVNLTDKSGSLGSGCRSMWVGPQNMLLYADDIVLITHVHRPTIMAAGMDVLVAQQTWALQCVQEARIKSLLCKCEPEVSQLEVQWHLRLPADCMWDVTMQA